MSNALTKAKTQLILRQPFFASMLLGTPLIEDESVGTLATNGLEIRYSPTYLQDKSVDQIVFGLAHEILHIVSHHCTRRSGRDPLTWNIATDHLINGILINEKIGQPLPNILHDSDLVTRGNSNAIGIYDLLQSGRSPEHQKPQPDQSAPGTPGQPLDRISDTPVDSPESFERELSARIIQAANAARMSGKLPGTIARMVKDLTAPKLDWRVILRDFLEKRAKSDYTYARPNRRTFGEDSILPGRTGRIMGTLTVALDMSGSISPEVVREFASELQAIHADTRPAELHIVYFDSKVSHTDVYSPDDTLNISAHGGGGTDFAPIFEYVRTIPECAACVILTDLWCDSFGTAPDCPVLWITTDSESAPFGTIVKLERK